MKAMHTLQIAGLGLLVIGALMLSVPAKAQYYNNQPKTMTVSAPSASFHSTSTMRGVGSAYSSNPSLNADGTAAYNGAAYSPTPVSRPRRISNPDDEDPNPNPLGDAILPLTLLAGAYLIVRATQRRKEGVK